jgi:eukaryotic-like serine/threonine-protein kinase
MPLEKLGPYKLEKILGRGGMGAVYVGVHSETGERAAVKVLSGHLADDEAFRERFKIEVETLKRLSHPNIVQLSGYGEDDGHLFYVMELVKGRSLHDELAAGRRFTWREVTRIGVAVAAALKHAHDRGIIHRDLKPANLLIDEQEHVKLTDFGIAKLYGGTSVTADGGVLGTADYMAPEQADGKQVTTRCDLYSLGSVLYALLAGRPPFAGKTVVQVITALKNEKPVPPRRLAPEMPEELENIILQLLEKDPQKRIPTALVLMNRLKAMEHALSLDTRVIQPGDLEDDDELRLAPDEGNSNQTQPLGQTVARPSRRETTPLSPDDARGNVPVSGMLPTTATGVGSSPAGGTMPTQATGAAKARAGATIHSAGTLADADAGSFASEPPPERKTHFTTVSEAELRRRDLAADADESSPKIWITAGLLFVTAAAIIGGVVFFATRPPSPDKLYERAKAAVDSGESTALSQAESDIDSFLMHFPTDPRAEEMQGWKESIDLSRREKQFRAVGLLRKQIGNLSPAERAYAEAAELERTQPEQALARYEAIVAVYQGATDSNPGKLDQGGEDKGEDKTVELAAKKVEELKESIVTLNGEQRVALRQQIERANGLAESDRAAAEKIWRGIITLYGEKAWAKDLVAQVEAKLATAEPEPPGSEPASAP